MRYSKKKVKHEEHFQWVECKRAIFPCLSFSLVLRFTLTNTFLHRAHLYTVVRCAPRADRTHQKSSVKRMSILFGSKGNVDLCHSHSCPTICGVVVSSLFKYIEIANAIAIHTRVCRLSRFHSTFKRFVEFLICFCR